MDLSAFGLPELSGMAAGLAALTVSIVDAIKRLLTTAVKGKWTAKIPSAAWFGLALAIPTPSVCRWVWIGSSLSAVRRSRRI